MEGVSPVRGWDGMSVSEPGAARSPKARRPVDAVAVALHFNAYCHRIALNIIYMRIRPDLLYAFSRRANILAWAALTFVAMMPLAAKDHGTTTVVGVVTGVSDGDTVYLTITNAGCGI